MCDTTPTAAAADKREGCDNTPTPAAGADLVDELVRGAEQRHGQRLVRVHHCSPPSPHTIPYKAPHKATCIP